MGVGEEEKLVYFGVGKSYFGKGQKIQFEDGFREDFSLMVSSGYDFVGEPEYTIPENETESQDYIGACDLIISKFGYGIVSEGIMSKTPMILARRKILEDERGMERLKKYGLGEEISREDMIEGNFISKIEKVYGKDPYEDMPDRLKRDGKKEIVETIEEFLY